MSIERNAIEVPGVAAPAGHYSHGIVTSGRTLDVAGQVALDDDGDLVGEGDAAAQTRQILANMEKVVERCRWSHGRCRPNHRVPDPARGPRPVGAVRKEFFPDPAPANTLLVVASLAEPRFLVEIDAIVALP